MKSVMEGKQQANPGQSAAKALRAEFRRRGVTNDSATRTSPTRTSLLAPHVIEEIQRASERASSRGTRADDARQIVNFQSGESSESALENMLLVQGSLLNPQFTAAPASTPIAAKTVSGTAGVGGGRKKRTRPSKKPPTKIVDAKPTDFRNVVQKLTGGTFCSQASGTASHIVSSAAVTRMPEEVPRSAAKPYVVRSHPSRFNADSSETEEISAVPPPNADTLPVSQELSDLPAFLFQGSEDDGVLDEMMGYTNQSSWMAMSTLIATESVGVSSSSQFPAAAVYPSDIVRPSLPAYRNGSLPFLLEESDASKEGSPYQREAQATEAGSEDMLPRHFPPDQEDSDVIIDSWLNPETPTLKGMYIN